jgi:hypothetical protein
MEEIKPNDKRAKVTVIVFYVIIAVNAVYLLFSLYSKSFYTNIANGVYYTDQSIMLVAGGEMAMGIAHFSANLVCIIMFVMWFRRAYENLNRIGKYGTQTSDSMAFWGFVIPILNLFKPYQMMKEVWHKTQQTTRDINDEYEHSQSAGFILIWWLCFVVLRFVNQISVRMNLKAETYEDFASNTSFDMFASILDIVCALLTIYMIKKVAVKEKDLALTLELKKSEEKQNSSPFSGEQTISP